jgi:hypothetical protein
MLRIRGTIGDWPVDLTLEMDDADWARLGAQVQVVKSEASEAPAKALNQAMAGRERPVAQRRAIERAGPARSTGRADRQRGSGQTPAGAVAPLLAGQGDERRGYALVQLAVGASLLAKSVIAPGSAGSPDHR